jgi:hypothetical protein
MLRSFLVRALNWWPGFANNSDRGAHVFLLASNTGLHAYDVEDDDWFSLASPGLAGTFGAGARAVMMPSQGPRGTLAGGATTSSVVLSTALRLLLLLRLSLAVDFSRRAGGAADIRKRLAGNRFRHGPLV